jgi:formate hydrogenlyase subunit 3/multisubunit Na+/H+ antiporter MnhD subunit
VSYAIESGILVLVLVSVAIGVLRLIFPVLSEDKEGRRLIVALGICAWVICSVLGLLYGIWRWRSNKRRDTQ